MVTLSKRPQGAAPTAPTVQVCGYCKQRQHLSFDTDFNGNMVESLGCGCALKRSKGLCIDCSVPVSGASWRCARCRASAPGKAATRRKQAAKQRKAMLDEDAKLGFPRRRGGARKR